MKQRIWLVFFLLPFLMFACQSKPIILQGDILFEDDFSTRENQWTSLVNDGGVMNYDAEGFRFYVKEPGLNFWATPGLSFDDVGIEVDTLQYAGPVENRIGVICRHRDDQNFYYFVISADGYYAIGKIKAGEQSLLGQEAMLYSSAIKTGVAINHLRADCQGSTLRFYINQTPIALVEDFDLTEGDVGLLAGTFNEGGLDVLFDNFVVVHP
ncbi:MAG: hypothetical protein ISR59_11925 [Anaerolineales bacterium]|uniref:3-keto-disaccharide hydrolase domain-containing protein n=1 Tax=Candidatus Desulfolinea nitratireducens TaxID=2841698 RepID=A0A8J6TE82_9CHLR|nr:hypothetical protein [Candidatus Desulfolinea nitratireducens]MBL6961807.1 hypothetical protein [Anaerolineales bacterium]